MSTTSSRARTVGWVLLVLAVLFYAPLALTSFFNGPTGPNLQDHVLQALLSPRFAFGFGSGHDGHDATYVRNFANMWIHSVIGTATLVAGLSQFSTRLRTRHVGVHRTLGKVFIAGCAVVAVTAAVYLVRTPDTEVFSGRVFAEVLWLLATATLGLAVLAFVSIRRRDLIAHREYATMAFALICSAGWLRLMWITVGQVWDTSKEMINLFGIQFAAPFLATCVMLYVRPHWRGKRGVDSPLASRRAMSAAVVFGVLGVIALAVVATQVDWSAAHPAWFVTGWTPIVVGSIVPWVLHTAWMSWMAFRAGRRGRVAERAAWRTYLLASASAPGTAALGIAFGVFVHGMPLQQAWYMLGYWWGASLVATYAVHAAVTTRWARRTSASGRVASRTAPDGQVRELQPTGS